MTSRSSEALAAKTSTMRDYKMALPEFADRFGPAYKAELAAFVQCCRETRHFRNTSRWRARARLLRRGVRTSVRIAVPTSTEAVG